MQRDSEPLRYAYPLPEHTRRLRANSADSRRLKDLDRDCAYVLACMAPLKERDAVAKKLQELAIGFLEKGTDVPTKIIRQGMTLVVDQARIVLPTQQPGVNTHDEQQQLHYWSSVTNGRRANFKDLLLYIMENII